MPDSTLFSPSQATYPAHRTVAWTLFDFANTGFSVMIVTFGYALYFQGIVAAGSDFYWGLAVSVSMLLCAIIAPPLGAAADLVHGKKQFLLAFTLVSVVATAGLYAVQPGMILLGTVLFVIANIGFEGGIVFYDALLPDVAPPERVGRVSGYGFAMGYMGAMVILALCFPLLKGGLDAENLPLFRLSFLVTAAFFLVFAVPLFVFVREKSHRNTPERTGAEVRYSFFSLIAIGAKRSFGTLMHIRSYPAMMRFLIAFFLYNDAILTVVAFASIYAKTTLQFSIPELLVFFVVIQVFAVVGSLVAGWLTDRLGARRVILTTLVVWVLVVGLAYFATTKTIFYGVGMLAGVSIGSCSSASRSFMAQLVPKERETEFFGFYDGFFGKASAIVGPLVFGVMSGALGQRTAIVCLSVFFVAGFWILLTVHEKARNA
jgi:MFS transporter, UMF1 family